MRKSFTLIEVMIVLMIVVSFLAIAWPRMRRLAGKTEIRQAAVDFQTACRSARDQAVRGGKAVQVRFRWGQSTYRLIKPMMALSLTTRDTSTDNQLAMTTDSTIVADDSSVRPDAAYQRYELPGGIVFASPNIETDVDSWADDRADGLPADPNGGLTRRGQLADRDVIQIGSRDSTDQTEDESISFYPEGRSDSATIRLLAQDTGDSILLQLRGFTGELSIGDITKQLDSADE